MKSFLLSMHQSHLNIAAYNTARLWEERLLKNLSFTPSTLGTFKLQLQYPLLCGYSPRYNFLLGTPLNAAQKRALQLLQSHGLTVNHLKEQGWFNECWQVEALKTLIIECQIIPLAAMTILAQLNEEQFTDILNLNKWQVRALNELCLQGVTVELLRDRDWFDSDFHVFALTYLIRQQHETPAKAMAVLHGLDWRQACAIALGLSRQEIFGLNLHKLKERLCLHDKRLKNEYLFHRHWFNGPQHVFNIMYLLNMQTQSQAGMVKPDDLNATNLLSLITINEARSEPSHSCRM